MVLTEQKWNDGMTKGSSYFAISIDAISRFPAYYVQSFTSSTLLYSAAVIAICAPSRMRTYVTKRVKTRYIYSYKHAPSSRGKQWVCLLHVTATCAPSKRAFPGVHSYSRSARAVGGGDDPRLLRPKVEENRDWLRKKGRENVRIWCTVQRIKRGCRIVFARIPNISDEYPSTSIYNETNLILVSRIKSFSFTFLNE